MITLLETQLLKADELPLIIGYSWCFKITRLINQTQTDLS